MVPMERTTSRPPGPPMAAAWGDVPDAEWRDPTLRWGAGTTAPWGATPPVAPTTIGGGAIQSVASTSTSSAMSLAPTGPAGVEPPAYAPQYEWDKDKYTDEEAVSGNTMIQTQTSDFGV